MGDTKFAGAVLVLANSKGGAGKSTTALVLAQAFAHNNLKTCIIDADPNRPIKKWKERGESGIELDVIHDTNEESIIRVIVACMQSYDITIVDLEGSANLMVSRAISRASLVMIPLQASPLDTDQAARAQRLVHSEEEHLGREVPFVLAFTRTSAAFPTRIEVSVTHALHQHNIPVLESQLNERAAYKSIFEEGKSLYELDPTRVSGIKGAIENAHKFADETFNALTGRWFLDRKGRAA